MKLQRFDIGAEIIAILTKGMYPNPFDAVREYIQNSIDAKAKNVQVKVRANTLVVQDNGNGMDHETLRKAVRVGVSDKRPGKDVGFMGIGIYSAYHLCDKLEIYTRMGDGEPNKLTMEFGLMKDILQKQKEKRLKEEITSDDLLDLQTLLEKNITLTDNGEFPEETFPEQGTRIELSGIEPVFYEKLSNFKELANYLRQVIPLHFDKKFSWANEIESKIQEICTAHNHHFEIVNLKLQVDAYTEDLYRPYKDSDFNSKNPKPQAPIFEPIGDKENFWGVAWGCHNGLRKVVETKDLRGFILKKQGFSIGTRENLVKYFPNGHTYFDRYMGEVVVTNDNLLPNAARNDFELSIYRTKFFDAFTEVAEKFDDAGYNFQQWTKADEELTKYADNLKKLNANVNLSINIDKLIDLISDVKNIHSGLEKRLKRKDYRPSDEEHKDYFGTLRKYTNIIKSIYRIGEIYSRENN